MNNLTQEQIAMVLARLTPGEREGLVMFLKYTTDAALSGFLCGLHENPSPLPALEPGTLALLEGREWTPCAEEMPPSRARVLATYQYGPKCEHRNVAVLEWTGERWIFMRGSGCQHPVLAWMHRPEPWEGEA